jgi:membrane protein YqaA with SNARE-associated domain
MSAGLSMWLQVAKSAAGAAGRHAGKVHSSHLLRWLASLGGLGIFAVSVFDSSMVPLPLPGSTDLLLLLLAAHRGATPVTAVWLAFCAIAGSMIGGFLAWKAGRKGGEVALERYVPKRFLGRVTGWIEKHGAWSIGVSAILPPPVPLTPFLLAAGALKVPLGRFLVFFGIARTLRYSLLAWLGLTYGHLVVRTWLKSLDQWSATILWVYGGLVLCGIAFGVWKFLRARSAQSAAPLPAGDAA